MRKNFQQVQISVELVQGVPDVYGR